MVVLVPVDERLTAPGGAGRGAIRTTGVEACVDEVLGATGECETFLAVDPETRQVVGTCGYRGPLAAGRREIAFHTFPPFEGRGWATAMTRALLARTFADPAVTTVVAHTLPMRDPATSVLRANGLVRVEIRRRDESGPDGAKRGRVWRWETHRPARSTERHT